MMSWACTVKYSLIGALALIFLPAEMNARGFDDPDVETEQCLAEGELVMKEKVLGGVTRSELFLVECDGAQRRAVAKWLDRAHRGLTRFQNGTWELNFSDSYRYERAAYLLDRELGLNMVPVAVIREMRRQEGALVEWIDHASHEKDSPHRPSGPEVAELARRKAMMRLFDALIYNTDRNTSNYLVDDDNWRLYLIDHSRAFRELGELPDSFLETRARLSRDLYERLRELQEESLVELLSGLVSRGQVRKILDKILEKIDSDRQQFGDEVIFSG